MGWLWLACVREPTFLRAETAVSPTVAETARPPQLESGVPETDTAGPPPADSVPGADTAKTTHPPTGSDSGPGDSGLSSSTRSTAEGRLRVGQRRVPCPAPSTERRFVRQEVQRVDPVSDWDHWAGGLVTADLEGDGREELLLLDERGLRAFRQDAGRWAAAPELVPAIRLFRPAGISAADADGDGDPEVVITQYGAAPVFLRNEGGALTPAEVGLPTGFVEGTTPSWADHDGDGDLDLALAAYGAYPAKGRPPAPDASSLLLNRGDGTFEDASDRLPPQVQEGLTFLLGWLDLDGDSRPELLALNDLRLRSTVALRWDGTGFLELANGFHPHFDSMGLAVGDWNDDGRPDLVESSIYVVSFMVSAADPAAPAGAWYFDAAAARGLVLDPDRQGAGFGWGVAAGDLDHDGDEDLHLVLGHHDGFNETLPTAAPLPAADHLWLHQEDGSFLEVGADPRWGLADRGVGRGLVLRDLDGDGWLDLVKAQLDGPDVAYWSVCGQGGWITVDLTDETSPNRAAVGARLEVEAAGRRWTRWQTAGSVSLFGGSPGRLHVGLGEVERVDRVVVVWPEGGVDVVARDVSPGTALTVTRRSR